MARVPMESLTDLQRTIMKFYHNNPFVDYLHIQVVPLPDGDVRLELDIDPEHTNLYGIAHGGTLLTMADTAMGAACLVAGKKVVTLDINVSFLKPVPLGGRIKTTAKVLHGGRRTMACESELLGMDDKLFAKANATFFVIGDFVAEQDREQ